MIKFRTFKFECKASSAEKNLQQEQAAFYKQLTQDYAKQFAGQTAILNALNTVFEPILAAGPGQYGFTPQEDVSLRTTASDINSRQFQNAQLALNENLASRGGGNIFTPSGATAQLESGLLTSEAETEAASQNAITQAGYNVGRQNFLTAAGVLSGNAGLMNPTSYAGVANPAGSAAFNSANIIQQQNSAWEGQLGGILGGVAGSILGGPIGGGIAKSIFGGGTPSPTPGNFGGSTSES